MGKSKIKFALRKNMIVSIPLIFIVIFLTLAFFSRQYYLEDVNPQEYHTMQHREYPFLVGNYSDIDVIIDISNIDPKERNVTVSFFIRGWFTSNYTEFGVWVQSTVSPNIWEYLNVSNRGSGVSHFFYQIEDSDRGPYSHAVWGYSERFPYDYYIIRYELNFWNIDPDLIFPPDFDPSMDIHVPFGWSAKTYVAGTERSAVNFYRYIYLVLSRSGSKIPFYSSPFLFTFFEYVIIGSLFFIQLKGENLAQRIAVLLTSSVLVLAFYNTFTTELLIGPVSYVQVFFVSVIFSNMVLLAFSIVGTHMVTKQVNDLGVFDLFGLILTSILPLVLFFLYTFFLISPEFAFLWRYFLDYRFLLWLTLYLPASWAFVCRKSGCLLIAAGLLVLLFSIFDILIQNADVFLLSLSTVILSLGAIIETKDYVNRLLTTIKKLRSKKTLPKNC